MFEALFEFFLRAIAWFFLEIIFYAVCYPIGWLMLKTLTLGQYPPHAPKEHNRDFVATVPLVVALLAITLVLS